MVWYYLIFVWVFRHHHHHNRSSSVTKIWDLLLTHFDHFRSGLLNRPQKNVGANFHFQKRDLEDFQQRFSIAINALSFSWPLPSTNLQRRKKNRFLKSCHKSKMILKCIISAKNYLKSGTNSKPRSPSLTIAICSFTAYEKKNLLSWKNYNCILFLK